MKYCAAYYSDIGIQKETNQDSLLLVQRGQTQDDEAVLAVICDGVGGLKMGERSSAAVVTAFRDWFDFQAAQAAWQGLGKALPNKIYRRGKTADMRILAPW